MYRRGLQARTLALGFLLHCLDALGADDLGTRLLSQPALSKDRLAFVYAGDIWVSDRNGQHPIRITAHPASEFAPHFSPDGNWIAFSAGYDNNIDVYVVPVQGGQPRRLTWHPSADVVTGWSPDGRRVLFVSDREVSNSRSGQLYEVPIEGGYERKIMKAVAVEGAWSADGKRLAYRPYIQAYSGASGWRQHRGGDTPPVWIIDPVSGALEKIPHVNASDKNPMWIGDDVAFISDRNDGAANLFLYDGHSHAIRQLTHETQWDIRSADAYGRTIVFEAGGVLKSLDLDGGQVQTIPIHLAGQAVEARPQWKDVVKNITNADLSLTGKRVLITARGDVFSVPAKDGPVRNLTATSGVREADAYWSRDGQRVAYLSDEGGIQALLIRDALGLQKPARHALTSARDATNASYYTLLGWSPDDRRIVFQDNHLHLYTIDLRSDAVTLVDTSKRRGAFDPAFSPDGQWLAYTVIGANYFTQVRLFSFASGRATDLADRFIQTDNPTFGGDDLLYFTASIDSGPTRSGLDMSTQERPLRKAIYAAVLASDGHSPLPPKSGDEEIPGKGKPPLPGGARDRMGDRGDAAERAARAARGAVDHEPGSNETPTAAPVKPTRIDLEGLSDRLVPIPLAERNYDHLAVAFDGALFYLARKQPGSSLEPPSPIHGADADLYRYSFEDRSEKLLRSAVVDIHLSGDRRKLLVGLGDNKLDIADANERFESKSVELGGLRMLVDPREEWHQIFDEVWRMERAYFYDPNMHGLDWRAVRTRYEPLLEFVQRREDLSDLLVQMIAEMQVGHNRTGGGDVYHERPAGIGLLGADFKIDTSKSGTGLYRIQRIYHGDRWNPFIVSPLTAPGVNVEEGDYILAINGHPLDATINIFALLQNTVEKQVALTVSHDGSTAAARTVTVIPVGSEVGLRQWDWVARNQEYVERKSGGRVAYVYLPDTGDNGYTYFNRMFFAQSDHDAVIIDDRRNGGGQAANYILDVLSRKYFSGWKDRDGLVFNTPAGAIYGPKVMLIDQDAGSGGDYLPYTFRSLGLGKLIGTRTWGGLIGISTNPPLIDGGFLTVPFFRMYTPAGEWHIENEGVAPDVDVQLDPATVNAGNDNQLDAAIAEVMGQLKTARSLPLKAAPPYPTQLGK